MIAKQNLNSFHIVERESKQRNIITWTYPTINEELKKYLAFRCFSATHSAKNYLFFYLRKQQYWIYVKQFSNNNNQSALVVIAEDHEPNKYQVLCDILAKKYIKSKNPADLVRLYLKLIISGSICYQENGTEISLDLKNYKREPQVKDIIRDFGLETILIYNAILLKRRIMVYHQDVEKLQQKMAEITNLVSIRKLNEYLVPLIENINELKGLTFYLAGTSEENNAFHEKYFDIYINLVTNKIAISKEAKDCFVIAKVHKNVAHFLVKLSESELPEAEVIEEINNKTQDILKQLHSIATCVADNKNMVSINDLKAKNYSPPLENFLINLAVAENMMML